MHRRTCGAVAALPGWLPLLNLRQITCHASHSSLLHRCLCAAKLTVTAVLKNEGNTRVTFSADNGASCDTADALVNPGSSSTCTLDITTSQTDLDYGGISRTLTFRATPNSNIISTGTSHVAVI